ncbi:MAG TPA: pitrilysin family protein [Pyrinomonadaceae bacterium]|nr:pitrilysin family protein [Pyrinomonadaceae bacterium]
MSVQGQSGGAAFVAEEEGVREYRLANGLKLLLVENRVAPVVTFLVVYRVGSRNEAVGYTGATHLLEHLLFKGTPEFNKRRGTQIAATLQRVGADYNATTWYDRTNYFETVPSDELELAVRLEADRMRNSFIADEDRQSEMTVVRNELERGQNEPLLVLDEAVYAAAFREHPYHHPTIGWRADVENVPTSRLKEFYDTFYHPNNATAIVVGDFDEARALGLAEKYFGAFPASDRPIPEVYTDEPPQEGERRLVVRRAGELPLVQIAFRTPAALGQTRVLSNAELSERALKAPAENDIFPLAVFASVLSNGVTSRLYQALVETELAVSVDARLDQFRDPGLFNVYATAAPGVEPRRVEEAILGEIARAAEGLTDEEVVKARRQIAAAVAYERDGTHNVAMQMSEAEAVADWRFYNSYARNVARVTGDDVSRAALRYLTEDNRTVGHFVPKQSNGASRNGGGGPNGDEAGGTNDTGGTGSTGGTGGMSDGGGTGAARLRAVRPAAARPHGWKYYRDPRAAAGDEGAPERAGGGPAHAGAGFAARVRREELETGAVLLAVENPATPTVALRASLRAGSFFEPRDRPGLAALTAEMLERGTRRRTKLELAGALEGAGAELSFSADQFAVHVRGRALAEDFPLVLGALAEMLREPSFPADELEKLKQQTIAAIREQQSETTWRAYERLTQLLFDEASPFYTHAGERLIESVGSITVDDVRGFYERRYGGRSLILSVAGGVAAEQARALFRELFQDFGGPESVEVDVSDPTPAEGTRREVVVVRDKANVDVLLGSAAPLRRDSSDYYAALIANRALGESTLSSRLGLQVRDAEGLTYGIASRFRSPGLAAGPWYIAVSVNPQNVERAITSALQVLRGYVAEGIRPEELADEKSSVVGSFKVSLSTNAGLASALWNAEFYRLGLDYVERFPEIVRAVTLEEVNAAVRRYFRPDHLTVVVAGDLASTHEQGTGPLA